MESAIDSHLRCPRTLSRRVGDRYAPAYPRYVARGERSVQQTVTALFGVQYAHPGQRTWALATLRRIVDGFDRLAGPRSYDLAQHVDAHDHHNLIAVAYWDDPSEHGRWTHSPEIRDWWDSQDRFADGLGHFRETIAPRVDQFETLYSSAEELPGLGAVLGGCSGEIEEHGYWGSMRDRIPLSQTDRLAPSGVLRVVAGDAARGGRVVVHGHDNLAFIRSGQTWRGAGDGERELFLEEFLPTLEVGMEVLERSGATLGCYSSRFLRAIDLDGNELDESYNIGHWRSLSDLERWAETSREHLQLFVRFLSVHARLDRLRFYQEVAVPCGHHQVFEYLNCHGGTGLMRDAVPRDVAALDAVSSPNH